MALNRTSPYQRLICRSCIHLLSPTSIPLVIRTLPSTFSQLRQKSTSTKGPDSITVRLLKDIAGYGKKGSYVPISRGLMRNTWHKFNKATYVTALEQRYLKASNTPVVRDVLFGLAGDTDNAGVKLSKRKQNLVKALKLNDGTPAADVVGETEVERVEVERVDPEQSLELLDGLIPYRMEFTRQQKSGTENKSAIFGSVTSADVIVAIRDFIKDNDQASRIVLVEDDVRFIKNDQLEDDTSDRIKELGDFEVQISVKGTERSITRRIDVVASEQQNKEEQNSGESITNKSI